MWRFGFLLAPECWCLASESAFLHFTFKWRGPQLAQLRSWHDVPEDSGRQGPVLVCVVPLTDDHQPRVFMLIENWVALVRLCGDGGMLEYVFQASLVCVSLSFENLVAAKMCVSSLSTPLPPPLPLLKPLFSISLSL